MGRIKDFLARESVDWAEVLDTGDCCESMYCLYLVQTLVADGSGEELAEIRREPSFEERLEVRKNLLRHKGVQWAINHLKTFKDLNKSAGQVAYLRMITHFISTFLIVSMSANAKLPKKVKQFSFTLLKDEPNTDSSSAQTKPPQERLISSLSVTLEIEHECSLEKPYLANYSDLWQLVKGDLGSELLDSIKFLDLATELTGILERLVTMPVAFSVQCNRRRTTNS